MTEEDSSSSTAEEAILQCKREALHFQQQGEKAQALEALNRARQLEFGTRSSLEDWVDHKDPTKLQQLAIYLKSLGDLEGAKQALLAFKQRRLQQQQQQQQQETQPTPATSEFQPSTTESTTCKTISDETTNETTPQEQESSKEKAEADSAGTTTAAQNENADPAPSADAPDDDDEDDSDLKSLLGEGDNDSSADVATSTQFTEAEMMDLEMMTEFQLGGFPVPTLEDYQTKISQYRQQALACKKDGQTKQALGAMRKMKQFQAVHNGLAQSSSVLRDTDDDHQWLEELTEEDNELIRELFTSGGHNSKPHNSANGGSPTSTMLELEDLEDMDPETLKDAMALGMQLPKIEDVQAMADRKKAQAVQFKRQGNLEGAKAALVEFKTLSQQVLELEALHQLLQQKQEGESAETNYEILANNEIRDEDLDALLQSSEEPTRKASPDKAKSIPAKPKHKSSQELKEEAIRLRDEKQTAEATKVLKLYKQALAREAHERELAEKQQVLQELASEATLAQEQQRLFQIFYHRLVDPIVGSQQIEEWATYADTCQKISSLIETKGARSVQCTRSISDMLMLFSPLGNDATPAPRKHQEPDNDSSNIPSSPTYQDWIEASLSPEEERLEVSMLGASSFDQNTVLKKLKKKHGNEYFAPKIQVHVSIQLPFSETETEKPIDLWFESSASISGDSDDQARSFSFDKSLGNTKYIDLPRGDSKFAKAICRRMERRKIHITVYPVDQVHDREVQQAARKQNGWIFGGSNKRGSKDVERTVIPVNTETATSLGKVVLETKDLLHRRSIVGDFKLLGPGKREVGGHLQVCLRTGIPYGSELDPTDLQRLDDLPPLHAYNNSLSFQIPSTESNEAGSSST